jgi:hypothetical protein
MIGQNGAINKSYHTYKEMLYIRGLYFIPRCDIIIVDKAKTLYTKQKGGNTNDINKRSN